MNEAAPGRSDVLELPLEALESLTAWIRAAILLVDERGIMTATGGRVTELLGYEPSELVGRPLEILVPEAVRRFHAGAVTAYVQRPYVRHPGSGLQLVGRRKDGSELPVDIGLTALRLRGEAFVLAMVTEVEGPARLGEVDERNRSLAEFMSAMSHELRTPLNSVMGFAELLESGLAGTLTEKQTKYVRNIRTSGDQMLNLVNDILDFNRIEAGQFQLLIESLEVEKVVDECLSQVEVLARPKGLVLERMLTPGLHVLSDRRRLVQILLNLLSNAVKFTESGAVKVASAALPGQRVRIRVEDTGPGIPPDELRRIFDPFYQGSLAVRGGKVGSGLGLALTKRLALALKADVTLASQVGKGSTATLLLPAPAAV